MLDEIIELTDYNRSHVSYMLIKHGKKLRIGKNVYLRGDTKKAKRNRLKVYDGKVFIALRKIWIIMNYMCGKRLVYILEEVIVKLEQYQEIEIDNETRQKLNRISTATIDRLLSGEKRKLRIKSGSRTKPGTSLKHHIPIRTATDTESG